MRTIPTARGELFHVYNRSAFKRTIFKDDFDYWRFLLSIISLQDLSTKQTLSASARSIATNNNRLGQYISNLSRKIGKTEIEVTIHAFTIQPNHFHMIISGNEDDSIYRFMQKVQLGYSKYYNNRYASTGHVFSGPFKAKTITDNQQLLHTFAYLSKHTHPDLDDYLSHPFSSTQDYVTNNRWRNFLSTDLFLEIFNNSKNDIREFLESSLAKENSDENLDF